MARTFVVGLDGASWDLVQPWIASGDLPNIASLRGEGTWATSRSCLPPVTFPNWKCYSSGKNPGKLGVYWFERIDLDRGRIEIMDGSEFETAELWDYLNDGGLRTGIINMPTMYPPRELDGFVVCGGPDAVASEYRAIDTGYTYPEDLEDRLETNYEYRVHPEPLLSSNDQRGAEVDEILDLLDLRFRVAVDLFEAEDLDFLHVTLFYLNVLQHFFWNDEPTKRAWMLVDEWLGTLSEMSDTNLFVMSDHGCAPIHTEFYVNEWLGEQGYLRTSRSIEDVLSTVGLTRESALRVAKRLGIVEPLSKHVPERLQKLVPQSSGVKRERKLQKVVLAETAALASGQGPIYLNPDFVDVRPNLIDALEGVCDDDGEALFTAIHRGEALYEGPFVDMGPDVVIEQRPGVHINDGIGAGNVQTAPDRWAAENTATGIFVANGPDIEPAEECREIRILDIAPTILATHGLDVPSDMDGEILPIFAEEPTSGTREPIDPPRSTASAGSTEVVDRLRDLGYMD